MNKQFCLLFISPIFYYSCLSQGTGDTSLYLFFETNSFELDTQQSNRIKDFVSSYPAITKISGYADTVGTSTYNLALSRSRAFSIYAIIKSYTDVPDTNIVAYYGESIEFSELSMNRFVQVQAIKPPSQIPKNTKAPDNSDNTREINLENLYFLPDKPVLSQESVPYIEELANQLKAFPAGNFEIVGHVNYQSRLDSTHLRDLYELSKLRAKAVYDYLVEFGIPATQITYKGVGNSQPVFASPKNDSEKKKNMRVQVIIRMK
jgi:outer membrane protein OmpA-like peptidoglycan-associated protein